MTARGRAGLLLGAILALQVLVSLPRLNLPFVDARAHWQHDDALFLLHALHSLDGAVPDARKVFGVARYVYGPDGRPASVTHYSHHPVLTPALFRAWVAATGPAHWSPRLFALLLSLATTWVLFGLLRRLLEDDVLAGALTALYAVLPLYLMYQDAWKHEGLAGLLFFSCARLAVEAPTSRHAAAALPWALAALLQAEWAVWAAGGGLAWLLWRRQPALGRRAAVGLAAGAAAAVGIALVLGFTPERAAKQALYRAGAQLGDVGFWGWLSGQADYLAFNFGEASVAAFGALLLAAAGGVRGRGTPLGLVALGAGLAWVGVFRNLSHVHHYAQWYLGIAYVLLAAGALEHLTRAAGVHAARRAAAVALLPLMALSVRAGWKMERDVRGRVFGQAEDIAVLAGLEGRVVFDPAGTSGPRDWWVSPNVALYTDPVWKRRALGLAGARGGAVALDAVESFGAGDRLVALAAPGAADEAARRLAGRAGASTLVVAERSPSFVYLRRAEP